jgi:YbbR domain-containing protein
VKTALRWLVSNLGLILLSLVLAGLVWAVAVEEENPTTERRYAVAIPVTIPEPPEGLIVYDQLEARVYVTVRAPESVWGNLQTADLHATVNLGNLGEGIHQVPVQVSIDREPAVVRRVEPEAITIQLEHVGQASVPVNVRVEGSTALGYIAQSPLSSPLTATVSGPISLVGQVAEAVAHVSVEGGRADVEGEFDLESYDGEGAIVPHVTLSPDQVAVHIPIQQLGGYRDMAVTALLEGEVAPGYRVSGVALDPSEVTVFGAPEAIAQLPGYLETTPMDIEGAQEDIEVRLPLITPEGVSLLMGEPVVTVRVTVVSLEGSVTLQREVEVQGLAPEMTATVAPGTVEVILSGPQPVLAQLQESDVRVIADLFGLTSGSYSVTPQVVVVPSDVTAESILPAAVQVEISSAATSLPGG